MDGLDARVKSLSLRRSYRRDRSGLDNWDVLIENLSPTDRKRARFWDSHENWNHHRVRVRDALAKSTVGFCGEHKQLCRGSTCICVDVSQVYLGAQTRLGSFAWHRCTELCQWWDVSYVVFAGAKRENFNHLTFSCFNYGSQITRICLVSLTHTARKSLKIKSQYKIDHDEN